MISQTLSTARKASPILMAALVLAAPPMAVSPYSLSANIGAASNYLWRGTSQTE